MEQNTYFKNVLEIIQSMELQLNACEEHFDAQEQASANIEIEIEEHFERCLFALAARKEELMKQVEQTLALHRNQADEIKLVLQNSIELYKEVLYAGKKLYSDDTDLAELAWQVANDLPLPQIPQLTVEKIYLLLPPAFIQSIRTYGKVSVINPNIGDFSTAEMVTTFADTHHRSIFKTPNGMCWNPVNSSLEICDWSGNSIISLSLAGDADRTRIPEAEDVFYPNDIVMNHTSKMFYVTNQLKNTILEITPTAVRTFAGSGNIGWLDGVGEKACFRCPHGIAIDQQTGNLFVSDSLNHVIRKLSTKGEVTTIAGKPADFGYKDGIRRSAQFYLPLGLCFDPADQTLLVCDWGNDSLRKVSQAGIVTTLCKISGPSFVTITANRTILVTSDSNKITKVTLKENGNCDVVVIAGTGKKQRIDGHQNECSFNWPTGLAVNEQTSTCFVAEYGSQTIRQISFATSVFSD